MRIVIVEDNRPVAEGIANTLRDRGHGVDVIHDGEDARAHLAHTPVDLLILDVSLPGCSGLEVLKTMRRANRTTPVLILTARSEVADRISGLDAGADDYLTKPFAMEELEARVRALLRRGAEATPSPVVSIGALSFDREARMAAGPDGVLDLPRREVAVLECLLQGRGRIISKTMLTDFLYGAGSDVSDTAVEVHISRLRKRLEPFGVRIRTARGLGYRIEEAG